MPRKTSLAILSFAALVLLLATAKLLRPLDFESVVDFHPRAIASPPEPVPIPKPIGVATIRMETPPSDSGLAYLTRPPGSLDAFCRALARTEAKQGVTRILHYGDSPVTADSITADARSLLQEQFGDAGHGFLLIAKPWAWYGHRGTEVHGSGWKIEPASQSRAKDGFHGLGGVSFRGETGATSRIHLDTAQARIEISFLRQPGGGAFSVKSEDQPVGDVNTDGPDKVPDWSSFPLPAGAHDIELRVINGSVRLFGASFSKEGPGLIYNSLGLNGAQVQVVVRYFDRRQWAAQLQHERPDLVILNYGTNESIFPGYIDTYYRGELREVIRRIRAAVPDASLLVMSPMDRGQRDSSGQIETVPILPRIVDIQREVAAETGCAFFNTFEAMGGAGTMARWYNTSPRLVSADFIHPLRTGARRIGVLVAHALACSQPTKAQK